VENPALCGCASLLAVAEEEIEDRASELYQFREQNFDRPTGVQQKLPWQNFRPKVAETFDVSHNFLLP